MNDLARLWSIRVVPLFVAQAITGCGGRAALLLDGPVPEDASDMATGGPCVGGTCAMPVALSLRLTLKSAADAGRIVRRGRAAFRARAAVRRRQTAPRAATLALSAATGALIRGLMLTTAALAATLAVVIGSVSRASAWRTRRTAVHARAE